MLLNEDEFTLFKSITRSEAKSVHKELPPGGVWRTVKGHHIYIKDGKVLAGSIPGVTKAKKATKAQLAEHQTAIDKEAKGTKKDAKKSKADSSKAKRPKTQRAGTSTKATGTTGKKAPGKNSTSKQKAGVKDDVPSKPKKTTTGAPRSGKPKSTSTDGAVDTKKPSTAKSGTKAPKKKAVAPKEKADGTKAKVGAGKDGKQTKPTAKDTTSKGTGKSVSRGGKKATSEGGAKSGATAKKTSGGIKDIRSEAQKNRTLAYDVGDKVGGARKDEFIASFKDRPTITSLEELEKMSGAIAQAMVTKANLLPKYDFQAEHDSGVDLPTAILKKLMFDRIAPKPDPSTPETRKAYLTALNKVQRHFGGIKDIETMRDALSEVRNLARTAKRGQDAEYNLKRYEENPGRYSYFNSDAYKETATKGKEAQKALGFDVTALGDKFNNLLTDYDSMQRTIDTVRKNTKEGWDKYLAPQAKKAPKKKGEENKVWQRQAVDEHLRTGGKATKVAKPEDLVKQFNLRGVEFGHWVNDSSGLYHLKRSAEAFDDLADTLGIDPKDVSLNGRLAIAFGARGKGGALAHYEPDRKVINMTKYGGAGSLAHEWGHALDNILHQYSKGGQESLDFGSQQQMGDADPKLKALYDNVMDAITKPAPGEKGGSTQLILDSEVKQLSRYYPEMRRQVEGGMEPADVYNHWASKIHSQYDRYINSAKTNPYHKTDADRQKAVKKYEQKRKRELSDIGHYLAHELRRKQNGGAYGGDHYKGHIEIETGKSEYMSRMEDTQPGKMQNGNHYWSAPEEVFARVFESYVEDKLKQNKRYNNYLVHGTTEGHVKVEGAPFPLGKERQHMFKAMDNLMKHISKGALKKALVLELLASGSGDRTFDLRKSMGFYDSLVENYKKVKAETNNREEAFMYTVDDLPDYEEREHLLKMLNNMGEEIPEEVLEKSLHGIFDTMWKNNTTGVERKRSAYNVPKPEEVIYIPTNRLKVVYQTDLATNWDKVNENKEKMERGEHLEPVVIGLDYDIHDGHHRYEASKLLGYEHIPCIVKGGNDLDRERAVEAYREVWKSILPDPVTGERPAPFMYRGVGRKELDYIMSTGHIQSKGKGNDADKGTHTCFSNLFHQAEGYARSQYDLYNESDAYVLVVNKPSDIEEDEHGELVASRPIPYSEVLQVVYIPQEENLSKGFEDIELLKSFDESKHSRDEKGRFAPGMRQHMVEVVKTAKPMQLRERVRPQHLRNDTEEALVSVVRGLAQPLQEEGNSGKPFDREKAKSLMVELSKMGFHRVKELERKSTVQMGVEYNVTEGKSLIINVGISKQSNGSMNVTVDRFRYKDEANFIPNYRKRK